MSEEEYEKIYETTKLNSIGEEKKSSAEKTKSLSTLKIATGVLITILATAGIIALFIPKKEK